MSAALVLTLHIGPDRLFLGPASIIGGPLNGLFVGHSELHGSEDTRRWLIRACQEPGALIQIRQQLILWTGDAHHINRLPNSDLPDYVAKLCISGRLSVRVSRRMSARDASSVRSMVLPTPSRGPVGSWSIATKIDAFLKHVPQHLTGSARHEFNKTISPEAIRVSAGILTVWASSRDFGYDDMSDVVLLKISSLHYGPSLQLLTENLAATLSCVVAANRDEDLNKAAEKLARLITFVGASFFNDLLSYAASRAGGGAMKSKRAELRR